VQKAPNFKVFLTDQPENLIAENLYVIEKNQCANEYQPINIKKS
jgi:hypothetical protein